MMNPPAELITSGPIQIDLASMGLTIFRTAPLAMAIVLHVRKDYGLGEGK